MVIATKANGSPRCTVDLQKLNEASTRQIHPTRNPYHLVREIPANTKKSTYDCWNGYQSVPIHKDDKHKTTFITEFGRYRYKTSPQGYQASGDGYTQRYYAIVEDQPNKALVIDDACQWESSVEKSFYQLCRYIEKCGNNGIILNPVKFKFAEEVVDFCGYEIGPDYVRSSKKFHAAIADLQRPVTLTDVRSFFGLVEQVSYTFHGSEMMAPFRELLRPSNAEQGKINWTNSLKVSF